MMFPGSAREAKRGESRGNVGRADNGSADGGENVRSAGSFIF